MPAVYIVAIHEVTDTDKLQQYVAGVLPTLSEAEIVAADDGATTMEGEPRNRAVILKFDSEEAARHWYDSDAYGQVRQLRLDATTNGWLGLVKAFG